MLLIIDVRYRTIGSTPEEHAAQIKSDLVRWAKIAKAANLKIN